MKAKSLANVTELEWNLGSVDFIRKFLPNLASMLRPLHDLFQKIDLGSRQRSARECVCMSKEHLQDSPMLVLDKLKKPLRLDCDALHYEVGVVILHVMENSEEKTFAFAAIIHGVTIHKLRKGSVYCVSGEDLRC